MTKAKYQEVTIRVPVKDLKEIAEIAVEYALEDFSDKEIRRAGVKPQALAKMLLENINWGKELETGLVDHLQDLCVEFGKEIGYRTPLFKDTIEKLAAASEAIIEENEAVDPEVKAATELLRRRGYFVGEPL